MRSYKIPTGLSAHTQPPGTGIAIISTGAKESSISFARNLVISGTNSEKAIASLPMDNALLKSHFPDHSGFVHVIPLKQGVYDISLVILNDYYVAKNPYPLPIFEIKAGETVYLGEVFLSSGKADSIYEINNQADRDLALVEAANPDLNKSDVTIRVIKP
ncbi:MAG TPA: hypothetical protein DCZ95_17735 [Verrucomicrobia bacterium]|nr:MAG: hypothetical protein A2X46_07415 [Lentisphaerae bacterium GWF2_57_35]HBA85928.1 hypothetical protein [Verrucomicrobiota bacterium]